MWLCAFYSKGRENGCFIMTDYLGKREKKRIAVIAFIIVVIITWLVLVIRINTIFPRKKIEKCGYDEWINYTPDIEDIITADVSISPVACKMYDR